MKRRVHRRKEKGGEAVSSVQCTDALELVSTVSTSHKVSSFDFGRTLVSSDEVEVLFGLNNNSMQVYKFGRSNGKKEESGGAVENTGSYEKTLSIALAGHRSDVRALCLTSTDDMVLSVGQKESKMWSVRSLECVRSLDVENGLCCCVLPGDKHAGDRHEGREAGAGGPEHGRRAADAAGTQGQHLERGRAARREGHGLGRLGPQHLLLGDILCMAGMGS